MTDKKAKKQKAERLTLASYAFDTDYRLAAISEALDITEDLIDILWNQLAALEQQVYSTESRVKRLKKRWFCK